MDIKYIEPFSLKTLQFSKEFDEATINGDLNELHRLVDLAKIELENEDTASQAQLCYSIGTVYGDIASISKSNFEELTIKQLYYFRKSLQLLQNEEIKDKKYAPYIEALTLNLHTNLGNTLDSCGRKIAAIEQYKFALSIRESFGMALGNLGRVYTHYASLVSDRTHRDYFHYYAYNLLLKAAGNDDPNTHSEAKSYFRGILKSYDRNYIEQFLTVPLDIPKYEYNNQEEYNYRKWALNNSLFLNPLSDLPICEFCFAADVLQLPPIVAKINDKPIFHGMFNQIKQEYVFSRYQYYSSTQCLDEVHFADKDTCLVNFADYPQYSIRIERIKSAFKTLYALLDKIAYFINYYFDLGIKERDISFHSIWQSEKGGKSSYKYKNTLNPMENFSLSSIYWISKDFFEEFLDSPNPQAKHLRDIRNALEHKYVKVIWAFSSTQNSEDIIDDLAVYVSESELSKFTFDLLKLLREIIVCLSLAVGIEETHRKGKLDPGKIIVPMHLMDYEDEWKV